MLQLPWSGCGGKGAVAGRVGTCMWAAQARRWDSSSHELQPNLAHVRGTTIFVPVAFSQISLQNRRQLRTVLAASENFYRATPDAKGSFTPDALRCVAAPCSNATQRNAPHPAWTDLTCYGLVYVRPSVCHKPVLLGVSSGNWRCTVLAEIPMKHLSTATIDGRGSGKFCDFRPLTRYVSKTVS